MYRQKLAKTVLLVFVLLGAGAILGVRLTQGQQPDESQVADDALGSGFTYQGQLSFDGTIVDDTCDFTFALYDAPDDGAPLGTTETETDVPVRDGRFTVRLNETGAFGPDAFDGDARWLDIAVQCSGDENPIPLGRQPLSASPYASYALEAGHATSAESATNAGSAASAPWSGLTGIPADLADGDDDTTYTAGSGLTLNSGQFTVQGSPYANVIVVAKSGGDYTHIQTAIDSITGASDSNRYLIWVAPGLYQEQVMMKEYVDVAGAGQNLTTILWTGGSQAPADGPISATVYLAANSELRSLTVQSDGDGQSYTVAVHAGPLSEPTRITAVTTIVSGASSRAYGIYNGADATQIKDTSVTITGSASYNYGIVNDGASETRIDTVNISVSGAVVQNYGLQDLFSESTLTNATISTSGAIGQALLSDSSVSHVHHSLIQGSTSSAISIDSVIQIATSQLDGPISSVGSDPISCVHSYDAAFNPLDENCAPIP